MMNENSNGTDEGSISAELQSGAANPGDITSSMRSATGSEKDKTVQATRTERNPLPFQRLGDFELLSELGRGGMGVVYKARETGLDREVALKILPPHVAHKRVLIDRFLLEAKAAASLNHDHIVPVYHIGEDRGTRFFAMKFIQGDTVSAIVKSARLAVRASQESNPAAATTVGRQDESTDRHSAESGLSMASFVSSIADRNSKSALKMAKSIAHLGIQVADALQHAHERGVIHRDIKPSNLMLDEQHKIWVTDFGLALLHSSPALTRTGDIIGTLRYMSPEQASGRRNFVDNRSDIYSLGITLYELLTLQSACRGRTVAEILREITFERPVPIRKLNPGIPRDLEAIIGRAIERNPNDRYPMAATMAEDLRRFLEGKKPGLKRYGLWKRSRDWLYERPVASGFIATSVLTLLVLLGMGSWMLAASNQKVREEKQQIQAAYSDVLNGKLVAEANLQAETDPGLALRLAYEGRNAPPATLNRTLLKVLDQHHEQTVIEPAFPEAGSLALAPGTSTIAIRCFADGAWGKKRPAIVYDLATGNELARLTGSRTINSAIFHPSLPVIITAGSNHRMRGQALGANELEFSPVEIWGQNSFELRRTLRGFHSIELTDQAFATRGDVVLLPQEGNRANFLRLSDYSEVGPALTGHEGTVFQAVLSPDGSRAGTVSFDGTIRIWDATSGEELDRYEVPTSAISRIRLQFSADSRFLLAQGSGVHLIGLGKEPTKLHLSGNSAAFVPGTNRLVVVPPFANSAKLVSMDNGEPLHDFEGSDFIDHLAVTEDGRYLALNCYDKVKLFDLRQLKALGESRGHRSWITDLKMLDDGTHFATTGADGTTRLWNIQSDAAQRTIQPSRYPTTPTATWSPDGDGVLLATTQARETVLLSLEDSMQKVAAVRGACEEVLSDGRFITREEFRLTLWSARQTEEQSFEFGVADQPNQIRHLTGTEKVLVTGMDGELTLWDLAQRRKEPVAAEAVYLCRDDINHCMWLALADRWLARWNADASKLEKIRQFSQQIRVIQHSADGQKLLLGLDEGQLLTWDIANEKVEWQRLESFADLPIDEAEKPQIGKCYFVNESGSKICIPMEYPTGRGVLQIWDLAREELLHESEWKRIMEVQTNPVREAVAVVDGIEGISLWSVAADDWTRITDRPGWTARFWEDRLVYGTAAGDLSFLAVDAAPIPIASPVVGMWDIEANQRIVETPLSMRIFNLSIVPGQQQVVLAGQTFGADYWNLEQDVEARLAEHATRLVLADFVETSTCITVGSDGSWTLQDLAGNPVALPDVQDALRIPHRFGIEEAILTPDRSFLLTTDLTGVTYKTNLANGVSEQIELGLQGPARHAIAADNHSVLTFDGSSQVIRWDLRSNSVQREEFEGGVFEIDFAPQDQTAILIRGEGRPRSVPRKLFAPPSEKHARGADAWIWDLVQDQRRTVEIDGDLVDARFSPDGGAVYLLSTQGQVEVLGSDTLERQVVFEAETRIQFLLDSTDSELVFCASNSLVWGFQRNSGELVWEFPARFQSQFAATVRGGPAAARADWRIRENNSNWLVIPTENGFEKIPMDLPAHADERGMRELTKDEERRFLGQLPPTEKPAAQD